jgi:cytochrome c
MRLKVLPVLLATCVPLSACVNLPFYPFTTDEDAAAHRGYNYARDNCAGCHQVGYEGVSPDPHAPAFGQIHRSFSRTGLERELDAISEVGHFTMKARPISPADRSDVAAYIENLKRP